jgi:hypothetical protein
MTGGGFGGLSAPLAVHIVEDPAIDGSCLVRDLEGGSVQVAVAHDGSTAAADQTEFHAEAVRRTPAMAALLIEALGAFAEAFDTDAPVSGTDLVNWFSPWRSRVRGLVEAPVTVSDADPLRPVQPPT